MYENSIFRLLLLITISIILTGCGVKAFPGISHQIMLPEVNDLKYDLKDNILNLSWTIPGTKEKKAALDSFKVYRSKTSLTEDECAKCPVIYQSSDEIRVKPEDIKKGRINYTEVLEKGYRYIYKVTGYTGQGTAGKDSNTIKFSCY